MRGSLSWGAQRPVSNVEIHWGFCVSKSKAFALKSSLFALLGAKGLVCGAAASGCPCGELEGRSPSKVAGGVGGSSRPPIVAAFGLGGNSRAALR